MSTRYKTDSLLPSRCKAILYTSGDILAYHHVIEPHWKDKFHVFGVNELSVVQEYWPERRAYKLQIYNHESYTEATTHHTNSWGEIRILTIPTGNASEAWKKSASFRTLDVCPANSAAITKVQYTAWIHCNRINGARNHQILLKLLVRIVHGLFNPIIQEARISYRSIDKNKTNCSLPYRWTSGIWICHHSLRIPTSIHYLREDI